MHAVKYSGPIGDPINLIYGSSSPWRVPEFPLVQPSADHVVLYQVGSTVGNSAPLPQPGQDKWDQDHVKMPCSNSEQNVYDVTFVKIFNSSPNRWELIKAALTKHKPIKDSHQLAKAILKYNTKFASAWTFGAMHKFFNQYLKRNVSQDFFDNCLPEIIKLALALPQLIQTPIPLLKKGKNKSVSLSQLQIASLLANAFLCTFPRRNSTYPASEFGSYPRINFSSLYERENLDNVMEKLRCIIHYFNRFCHKVPTGVVTFSRRSLEPQECPQWTKSETPIKSVPLHVTDVSCIEEAEGLIQVDFANKFLGGGILGRGCVQEEIRFLMCPELMVSMLFTEKLEHNEAVMVIGCEQYCTHKGYGSQNFRFVGDYVDNTPLDSSGRRRCAVLAIDAIPFRNAEQQYHKRMVNRELTKAWIGFSFYTDPRSQTMEYPGVATGNWGCGAFKGSPQLKSLLQLMACVQARRPMAYYTFHDTNLKHEFYKIRNLLAHNDVTVGQLYKLTTRYCNTDRKLDLFTYVEMVIKEKLDPSKSRKPRKNKTPGKSHQSSANRNIPVSEYYQQQGDNTTKRGYNTQQPERSIGQLIDLLSDDDSSDDDASPDDYVQYDMYQDETGGGDVGNLYSDAVRKSKVTVNTNIDLKMPVTGQTFPGNGNEHPLNKATHTGNGSDSMTDINKKYTENRAKYPVLSDQNPGYSERHSSSTQMNRDQQTAHSSQQYGNAPGNSTVNQQNRNISATQQSQYNPVSPHSEAKPNFSTNSGNMAPPSKLDPRILNRFDKPSSSSHNHDRQGRQQSTSCTVPMEVNPAFAADQNQETDNSFINQLIFESHCKVSETAENTSKHNPTDGKDDIKRTDPIDTEANYNTNHTEAHSNLTNVNTIHHITNDLTDGFDVNVNTLFHKMKIYEEAIASAKRAHLTEFNRKTE